jgi:hypothetical protein
MFELRGVVHVPCGSRIRPGSSGGSGTGDIPLCPCPPAAVWRRTTTAQGEARRTSVGLERTGETFETDLFGIRKDPSVLSTGDIRWSTLGSRRPEDARNWHVQGEMQAGILSK